MKISLLIIGVFAAVAHAEHVPKMVAQEVPAGRRLSGSDDILLESSGQYFALETCIPGSPVIFPVSSGEGKGMIALIDNVDAQISVSFSNGKVELSSEKVPNVFSAINDGSEDGTVGQRLTFEGVSDQGATATVECSSTVELFIAYEDRSGLKADYQVTTVEGTEAHVATTTFFLPDNKASKPLKAKAYVKGHKEGGRRSLKSSEKFKFHDETDKSLSFDFDGFPGNDAVIIDFGLINNRGQTVYRSAIVETQAVPPALVASIELDSACVNADGDLVLTFSGIPDQTVLLKAMVSLQVPGEALSDDKQIELSAMSKSLVLNEGWIHAVTQGNNTKITNLKITISSAVALDPNQGYIKVAELDKEVSSKLVCNRRLLKALPTTWKAGEITVEMNMGRPPANIRDLRGARNLQSVRKKILIHGYCSPKNPFPISQFSNAVEFSDPDASRRLGESAGLNNWSNDQFAQKIGQFAVNNGIGGCGLIAHSQGGLASLHLYTYYWSCLDYSTTGGTRMIQSVGSPYQGTNLAGNLAAIGDVFGAGCGTNNDLTHSGASVWLGGIPTWARNQVHYFTTEFKYTAWWVNDYCHLATDLFLSDPEDGTVEKARGQLAGGNNRGNKVEWCHTTDMRDPAQCTDSSRNSDMNDNAKY